jgi:hypothetical protein
MPLSKQTKNRLEKIIQLFQSSQQNDALRKKVENSGDTEDQIVLDYHDPERQTLFKNYSRILDEIINMLRMKNLDDKDESQSRYSALKETLLNTLDNLLWREEYQQHPIIKLNKGLTREEKQTLRELTLFIDEVTNQWGAFYHTFITPLPLSQNKITSAYREGKNIVTIKNPQLDNENISADIIEIYVNKGFCGMGNTTLTANESIFFTIVSEGVNPAQNFLTMLDTTLKAPDIAIKGTVNFGGGKISADRFCYDGISQSNALTAPALALVNMEAETFYAENIRISSTQLMITQGTLNHCHLETASIAFNDALTVNNTYIDISSKISGINDDLSFSEGQPLLTITDSPSKQSGFMIENAAIMTDTLILAKDLDNAPFVLNNCSLIAGKIQADILQLEGDILINVQAFDENVCFPNPSYVAAISANDALIGWNSTVTIPSENNQSCETIHCRDIASSPYLSFNHKKCVNLDNQANFLNILGEELETIKPLSHHPYTFFESRREYPLASRLMLPEENTPREPLTNAYQGFPLGTVALIGAGFLALMLFTIMCLYKKVAESTTEPHAEHEKGYRLPADSTSINFS